ncbi:MAG: MOSC domain-containing protein [Cyclobacteriaceae bacterium]|nr:MOSC domain-containing protein [Cyclobacteriaceae bacterium]
MALQLSEIWIYPVKSLGGIRLKEAKVLEKGLQWDRRYMLMDRTGRFMTQREHHRMSQFHTEWHNEGFLIRYQREFRLLPFEPTTEDTVSAQVWDDSLYVRKVKGDYHDWFSVHLGTACELVFFPESNERRVDPRYAADETHVSLADGYPFLVVGQASLDDLNARLDQPVPMNRFRPNLVFTGGQPFEEDTWQNFTIGSNRFRGVKPCARCVLTTIDQETSLAGKEPLRTLAAYRTREHKVYFGQNAIAIDHEKISEGDVVEVG